VQRYSCRSSEAAPGGGDDVTAASLATPGGVGVASGNAGTLSSRLVHKATMLVVCVSAALASSCVIDTRVDVIISLPRLFELRRFHLS